MLVNFQYRRLHHLEQYCTLTIEAWLKFNMHFDRRYLELWNACIFRLLYIVLNFRDGIVWFGLMLNVPVNNFSVMLGRSHRFLGITSAFFCWGGGGGGGVEMELNLNILQLFFLVYTVYNTEHKLRFFATIIATSVPLLKVIVLDIFFQHTLLPCAFDLHLTLVWLCYRYVKSIISLHQW